VKWAWIFFFSEKSSSYTLEFGPDVSPKLFPERIVSTNNMRPQGGISVNTGPLQFTIDKQGSGFLDKVHLDLNNNNLFEKDEKVASAPVEKRGTFLDILDENGIDMSKAIIHEVFREKGSGPLHTIFRVEGTYVYENENNPSPFIVRIHAYAGKSYIRVLHTLTYTGEPDKHKKQLGQHANIATQNEILLSEETSDDPGWTQPNDQIAGCGLTFNYHLNSGVSFSSSTYEGDWYENPMLKDFKLDQLSNEKTGIVQTGPNQNLPDKTSSSTERIKGFNY